MKSKEAFLPWTGAPVRMIEDVHVYLSDRLFDGAGKYLPRSITLFLDTEIDEPTVDSFLRGMAGYLKDELRRRMFRRDTFVNLGLLHPEEMEAFLTERTNVQPWAIYYSGFGGLGVAVEQTVDVGHAERGVIPCSTMRNHGVAWIRNGSGSLRAWLATSRKEGQDWDWDSDIGHESAHAAFAQVPLFLQASDVIDSSPLSAASSVTDLSAAQLARILYFYSELAVVAVRGEPRQTQTGVPVAERQELHALLELSDELAPRAGFRKALRALERVKGLIGVNGSPELYEIAAPVIRIIPFVTQFANWNTPPDLPTFRRAVGSIY